VRDGLWASLFAGHAGAAGYWYWERVAQESFYHEFSRVALAIERSGLLTRPNARPMQVIITGTSPAPLVFAPGRGYGPTETFTFHLPADVTPDKLAGLSAYQRGPDPRKPEVPPPSPLTLNFTAPVAAGVDWVQFGEFTFPDLGRTTQATAIGNENFVLARVTTLGDLRVVVDLQFSALGDGAYELTELDLDQGVVHESTVTIEGGTLRQWSPVHRVLGRDVVLVLRR
jgi:hypothetical protein